MDISLLEKYDSQQMYKIYDNWPNLAKQAYDSDLEPANFENIDHIVFAGMGGSGAMGDLFASILSKTDIHVTVVKGYLLPKTVDENTLVVTTSVSGNTVETLTVLESAQKTNCKIIAFCSGGKMKQYCVENKINFRKIDSIHSPRSSFVKFVYSILNVLHNILPINEKDVLLSIDSLFKLQKQISSDNLSVTNPAINLAKWITGIPVIYFPHGLQSSAIRFKSSLQENTKIHVILENIIETCHNGIVSWERPSNVQPILIKGQNDQYKTLERWKIIESYFDLHNIDFYVINSTFEGILSKLLSLTYLFDYSSIYAAVLKKIDPSPTRSIDFVKNRL